LQADYADVTFVVNKSHQVLRARSNASIKALLGCLNSAVTAFFHVNVSAIAQRDDFPKIVMDETRRLPLPAAVSDDQVAAKNLVVEVERLLAALREVQHVQEGLATRLSQQVASESLETWTGRSRLEDVDYFGWEGRYPSWVPETKQDDGWWFPNGVSPPVDGSGPGDISWNLIARVYPSYPLPGIDEAAWEAAAWEGFCDLLCKNKSKIGNTRIRAELTGRGAITNPSGPLRQLRETFLEHHRKVRANRARAAEIDFLIDRIVFQLFELTLEEQKLILLRVGPGRPLPPRRRGARRNKRVNQPAEDEPTLFDS
jgi:hypothetical protein